MNTDSSSTGSASGTAPGAVTRARIPPALAIGVGAVLLALGAGAAGLALQGGEPAPAARIETAASLAPQERLDEPPAAAPAVEPQVPRAGSPEAPVTTARPATRQSVARAPRRAAQPAPATAAVCASCGVVESVQAVRLKGEGTGLGAVAGGVVGGVVGNQIGGGNGRKAMTVLGAIGGGVAGHEIEKNARASTVYNVKVRMDDGSLRSLRQSQAPAVGSRVRVEGSSLRAA